MKPPSVMVAMPDESTVTLPGNLVGTAQIDDEGAVDEDVQIVVAVDLQAEPFGGQREIVVDLVGEPKVVPLAWMLVTQVPLIQPGLSVPVHMLIDNRLVGMLGGNRY